MWTDLECISISVMNAVLLCLSLFEYFPDNVSLVNVNGKMEKSEKEKQQ